MQTSASTGAAVMQFPRDVSTTSRADRTHFGRTEQWCRRREREAREMAVREERIRIAREIHDTVAQTLTAMIVQLRNANDALSHSSIALTRERLEQAIELARDGLAEARRTVCGLRAQALETDDLCSAAEKLLRRMTSGTNLRAEFVARGNPRPLRRECSEHILRIIQESLTNVLRHANATVFAAELRFSGACVTLNLRDNGEGFDARRGPAGYGLLGIRERVAQLSGELNIHSVPGKGTASVIVLPLNVRKAA
jgi:signal transduction histidine kinase